MDPSIRQLVENLFRYWPQRWSWVTALAQFGFDVLSIITDLGIGGIAIGRNTECQQKKHLSHLPVHELKIDQSFVDNIRTGVNSPLCVMDGSSFTIRGETPCAEPSVRRIGAGCCGGWGLDIPGYLIM